MFYFLAFQWQVCNQRQIQLPAATKANTEEAGADVKESGFLADASHLEVGGCLSQGPSPWEDEVLMSLSPSPHLSGSRDFYKEEEGN